MSEPEPISVTAKWASYEGKLYCGVVVSAAQRQRNRAVFFTLKAAGVITPDEHVIVDREEVVARGATENQALSTLSFIPPNSFFAVVGREGELDPLVVTAV